MVNPAANVTVFLVVLRNRVARCNPMGNLVAALLWVVLGLGFLRADATEARD